MLDEMVGNSVKEYINNSRVFPKTPFDLTKCRVIKLDCRVGGAPACHLIAAGRDEQYVVKSHSGFRGGNFRAQWRRAKDSTRDHIASSVLQVIFASFGTEEQILAEGLCPRGLHASVVVMFGVYTSCDVLGFQP